MLSNSESTHLNKSIFTVILCIPTSRKLNMTRIVLINIEKDVIICAPLIPIFLPNNPDIIDPNKGKIIIIK